MILQRSEYFFTVTVLTRNSAYILISRIVSDSKLDVVNTWGVIFKHFNYLNINKEKSTKNEKPNSKLYRSTAFSVLDFVLFFFCHSKRKIYRMMNNNLTAQK